MFSQYTKNLLARSRDSISSESSQGTGAALFFSVPTLQPETEILESISLQTSQVQNYNQYDDEDEYQGSGPETAFLADAPNENDQNKQTPADIYRDTPMPIPRVSNNSLVEGLLPSTSIPPRLSSGIAYRKFKDPFFAVLFILGSVVMVIIGIVLLCTTSSSPLKNYPGGSVFFAIRDSIGPLIFAILFSTFVGFIWISLLRSFVQVLIWGVATSVPVVCSVMFIWTMCEAFTGALRESGKPDPQDNGLAVLSFVPLGIALGFIILLYAQKKKVEKAIKVIRLACEIINSNPRMLFISLMLLGAYILFSIIWLIFFSHVFLLGRIVQTSATWVFDQDTYFLGIYLLFMYFWTSSVICNIQRVTLAGVVSDWYFYRHEPERDTSKDIAYLSLSRATTSSLGSICLSSLILSAVWVLRWTNYVARKIIGGNSYLCITACLSCIDGIIENLNNYVLVYAGISGESFFTSVVIATKLFHRNLIFGLENDAITKLVLYIGSIIVALLCGFATFIYATHSLQSSYGYVAGIFAAIIPYYISQFYAHLMMNTVDAAFICYAIDLDVNKNHCNKAHEAFSNFNIQ